MYLISIIMPVYNADKYLKRTIDSIMNQTIGFENIELILVDDNSTDSSRNIIEEYSNKYSNIISFFSDKNHGFPGYGRNIGLKNATADYIMFIDNDDEYEPEFCKKIYEAIEKEKCDIVSSNFRMIYDNYVVEEDFFNKFDFGIEIEEDYMKFIKLDGYRNVTDPFIWTKIFRKSIIEENNIKFVEDRLSEDRLFLFNYYYYAENLIIINEFTYKHYAHGNNLSNISAKSTLGFINSYYDVLNLVTEKYGGIDKEDLFRDNILNTFIQIIFSQDQKCLLEKLYKFEEDIGFNSSLNYSWATFCNKLLLKRKFLLLIIIFKVLKLGKKFLDFFR